MHAAACPLHRLVEGEVGPRLQEDAEHLLVPVQGCALLGLFALCRVQKLVAPPVSLPLPLRGKGGHCLHLGLGQHGSPRPLARVALELCQVERELEVAGAGSSGLVGRGRKLGPNEAIKRR